VYKARCSGAEGAKLSLKQTRTWLLGGNIVENQPEHVMLDEEGVVGGLEDEVLHEGLRDVLVR